MDVPFRVRLGVERPGSGRRSVVFQRVPLQTPFCIWRQIVPTRRTRLPVATVVTVVGRSQASLRARLTPRSRAASRHRVGLIPRTLLNALRRPRSLRTGNAAEGMKRCGSIRVRADVGFGALDSRSPGGDCPLAPVSNRMTRLHALQGTSAPATSELADLPDRTGKTNREAAVFLPDPRQSGERRQWRAWLSPQREHARPVSRRYVRRAREGGLAREVLRTREPEPWFRARAR